MAERPRSYIRVETTKTPRLREILDEWAELEFPDDSEANAETLARHLLLKYVREAKRRESGKKGAPTPLARLKFIRGRMLANKERGAYVSALHTFIRGRPKNARQERTMWIRPPGDSGPTPVPQAYRDGWDNLYLACIQAVRSHSDYSELVMSLECDGDVPFADKVKTPEEAGLPGKEHHPAYEAGILDAKIALWSFIRTMQFIDDFPEFASISGYDDHLAFLTDYDQAKLQEHVDKTDLHPHQGQPPTKAVTDRIRKRGAT